MKICSRIKSVILTAALFLIAVFAYGCFAPLAKTLTSDTWRLFKDSDEVEAVFESVDLQVTSTAVRFYVVYANEFVNSGKTCNIADGWYEVKELSSSGFDYISIDFYDAIGNVQAIFAYKDELVIHNCAVFDINGDLVDSFDLRFNKLGEPPFGNGGGDHDSYSDFEAIKTAYKDEGYKVDVGEEDLDPQTAALIRQIKDMYSAMDYEMCVIGKNLDNISVNTEMYMLFGTPAANDARELEAAFKDAYPCARNGKEVIVYIWPAGTANFEPFHQAAT